VPVERESRIEMSALLEAVCAVILTPLATDTPSFGSPPYFHQTQQGLEPSLTGRSELYQANFAPEAFSADLGAAVIGPPINIPRSEQRDIGMFTGYIKPGVAVGLPASGRGGDVNHDHELDGASVGEGSSGPLDGQLGQPIAHLGSTPMNDDPVAVTNRQFENLILQENGGIQHLHSGAVATSQVVANGSHPHEMQPSDIPTTISLLNPKKFEAAFIMDHYISHGSSVVMSDSPLDGSPAHGDISGTAEDAESEDTEGAHSKSEENENGERGEDVWEGSMFPFCEEGKFQQL
jgi:hypothetical protein